MKSRRQEKVFPVIWPTGKCASLGTNQLFFETSFPRFRRTKLVGVCFLPARRFCFEELPARQEARKPYRGFLGRVKPFASSAA